MSKAVRLKIQKRPNSAESVERVLKVINMAGFNYTTAAK